MSELVDPQKESLFVEDHSFEWKFISASNLPATDEEIERMAAYEIARESIHANPDKTGPPEHQLWAQIYGDYFPGKPYLAIPQSERCALWESAKKKHLDLDALLHGYFRGLTMTYKYALQEEYQYISEQYPNDPIPFGEECYDYTKALVSMNLDLDYPDKALSAEFNKLLKKLRCRNNEPPTMPARETRGATGARTILKRLAAKRLLDQNGSPADAVKFLDEEKYDDPYPGGDSGWSKAKKVINALFD